MTEVLVHRLVSSTAASSVPSASSAASDASRTARHTQDAALLAHATLATTGRWLDIPPFMHHTTSLSSLPNVYVWTAQPPLLPRPVRRVALPEWGVDMEESDPPPFAELDEFETMVIDSTPVALVSTPETRASKQKLTIYASSPATLSSPALTEPKPDKRSLLKLIHVPHFLGPNVSAPAASTKVMFVPYMRVGCTAFPPRTGDNPVACLGSAWARCAWIVLLRGAPSWLNCTPAELVHAAPPPGPVTQANTAAAPPVPRTTSLHTIQWTAREVVAFWEFLSALREGGQVGPISIAFCASTPTGHLPETALPTPLDGMDYIKIYQDAQAAMLVRNALDLWGYADLTAPEKTRKRRVLKGARLVLVDELDEGVLVC